MKYQLEIMSTIYKIINIFWKKNRKIKVWEPCHSLRCSSALMQKLQNSHIGWTVLFTVKLNVNKISCIDVVLRTMVDDNELSTFTTYHF